MEPQPRCAFDTPPAPENVCDLSLSQLREECGRLRTELYVLRAKRAPGVPAWKKADLDALAARALGRTPTAAEPAEKN